MPESSNLALRQQFELHDRLANYGDGVFTTMHVVNGKIGLFSRHLNRLVNDAAALGMRITKASLQAKIAQALKVQQNGVLKVLVGGGLGGRGYARPETESYSLAVTWHAHPAQYKEWKSQGIRLGQVPIHLGHQPLLAGLKHANRLEQVLIKQALNQSDCDDCVVTDYNQTLIEASAANIFWYKQGVWFTPALSNAGVNGVMRQFILAHCNDIEVGEYHLRNLVEAESVFLSNALMQIVPVRTFKHSGANDVRHFTLDAALAMQNRLAPAYQQEQCRA